MNRVAYLAQPIPLNEDAVEFRRSNERPLSQGTLNGKYQALGRHMFRSDAPTFVSNSAVLAVKPAMSISERTIVQFSLLGASRLMLDWAQVVGVGRRRSYSFLTTA